MMKSISEKYWKRPVPFVLSENIVEQAKEFRVSPEIIKILHNRGIRDTGSIGNFLYPTLQDLRPPSAMKGITEAAEIICEVLENDGEIIIWGDYDVDGVTATSLLVLFFKNFTNNIQWFIPNRFSEGYGLNEKSLKKLVKQCKSKNLLLITVDCGIHNHKEVEIAKKMGCRVIVSDHHEPGKLIVDADVVINPKQVDCDFEDDMAGVGLAFYLAAGVRANLRKSTNPKVKCVDVNLKKYLDLVAIGTIADMVPLKGSNRILVKAGFEVLNGTSNPGITALLKENHIHSGNITSEDIGFQIAPKINAAGRLDDASLAVELFLEEREEVCRKIARKLTKFNNTRKDVCQKCLDFTLGSIDNGLNERINCVIEKIDYSIGVLGIVASRIAEKKGVPAILVTEIEDEIHGKVLKGSCRSVNGINIFKVLQECSEYLLQFGGHAMAAGITLLPEKIEYFKNKFSRVIEDIPEQKPRPENIDLELEIEKALSVEFIEELQLLEPFGVGNKKPKFYDSNVIIQDIRRIGRNGEHISFNKRGKFSNKKCVAFGFGNFEHNLKEKANFSVIYTVALSRFKRAEKWQAYLADIM